MPCLPVRTSEWPCVYIHSGQRQKHSPVSLVSFSVWIGFGVGGGGWGGGGRVGRPGESLDITHRAPLPASASAPRAPSRPAMDLTAPALGRMVEPSRQERLPRPGRRASNSEPATPSCGCSHHPTMAASVRPIAQEQLYGTAPPMLNTDAVQQEPQAELSLDGDGTLLTGFAPPRVVRRFETNRLSRFLDYGKQLAHRSLGSTYSVVHAADKAWPVRGAPANSAFKWPAPEQEGAPSHAHARFGTDVDWGDESVPAGIGASRSLDAELEADNPYLPESERSSPWLRRGGGICCVLGLFLLVSSASQGAVDASADEQLADDSSVPTASGGAPLRPDARSPANRRAVSPPPPPSENRPVLHYIAYQVSRALPLPRPPTCLLQRGPNPTLGRGSGARPARPTCWATRSASSRSATRPTRARAGRKSRPCSSQRTRPSARSP